MAAGASANLNASQINGLAGALAKEFQALQARVKEFNTFLVATNLQNAPYSMTSADEAAIKSAFATATALFAIADGGSTVGTANQTTTFMNGLVGPGPHN